jgi:hypothetical protein
MRYKEVAPKAFYAEIDMLKYSAIENLPDPELRAKIEVLLA